MNLTMPLDTALNVVGRLENQGDYLLGALMLTTGAKLSDLLKLTVGNLSPGNRTVRGPVSVTVPTELLEDLTAYLTTLRGRYEADARSLRLSGFDRQRAGLRWLDMPLFPRDGVHPPKISRKPGAVTHAALRPAREEADFVSTLQQAAFASGWRGRVHSHTLRHVFAQSRVEQGVPVEALQADLGHRDLMTTLLYLQSLTGNGLSFTPAYAAPLAA